MRTVILTGFILLADSITAAKHDPEVVAFVSILLMVSMFMDIIEFLKKT